MAKKVDKWKINMVLKSQSVAKNGDKTIRPITEHKISTIGVTMHYMHDTIVCQHLLYFDKFVFNPIPIISSSISKFFCGFFSKIKILMIRRRDEMFI